MCLEPAARLDPSAQIALAHVVSRDYIGLVKTAGIRELKAHLSSYLQGVQRGEALFITDRGRVVAEVRPPGAGAPITDPEAHRRELLVERGLVRPAPAPDERSWADWPGLGLPKGQAKAILDAEREE